MEMTIEQAEQEYQLKRRHGKIHIKKYIGSGGKVVVPRLIDGMPVTMICNFAFSNCYGITEAVLPDTVKYVGISAFVGCKNMKKITLCAKTYIESNVFFNSGLEEVNGLEYLAGGCVDANVFMQTPFFEKNETLMIGDRLLWSRSEAETFNVPSHIRAIGRYAFRNSKIKHINFPEGLNEIGNLAFYGSDLVSVRIPDSVEKFGILVFAGCKALTDIQLPMDFGRRKGWDSDNFFVRPVINDTLITDDNDKDDVLVYKDVSCITSYSAVPFYRRKLREKQVFPERLEYLKRPRLLSSAHVNVFRNDDFIVEKQEAVFTYDYFFHPDNRRKRFMIVFDLKDVYAEVLFYFPMMPYGAVWKDHLELSDFYGRCITNGSDGRFFDFELYDGHILEQVIPFRIKAEIAYLRCTGKYRLTAEAMQRYREYFRLHRKKLERILKKSTDIKIKEFFEEFL